MDSFYDRPDIHRFQYVAMAAPFTVVIGGGTREAAEGPANAIFTEVERLENAISIYRAESDISRVNHGAGSPVPVNELAFTCMKQAFELNKRTNGAFDVTIGPLMACWRNPDKTPRTPTDAEIRSALLRVGMDKIKLDEAKGTICLTLTGMRLDLGGIGKGFALDCAAKVLADYEITSALVHSESTVMALGAMPDGAGWPMGIGYAGEKHPTCGRIKVKNLFVSGSGVHTKGRHIFDPRTGKPVTGKIASWSICANGALADGLSTAYMVLKMEEIEKDCVQHPDTSAMVLTDGPKGDYVRYGDWPRLEYETIKPDDYVRDVNEPEKK